MKFFRSVFRLNLLLALLLLTAVSCGKKTDPVSKDKLEAVGAPQNFTLSATAEGITINNGEDAYLLVEKAAFAGDTCSPYTGLISIDPKESFTDTDVSGDTKYSYKFIKRSISYGILSEPAVRQITYSIPPEVLSAEYIQTNGLTRINIVPSDDFVRMDLLSGERSILQTGKTSAEIPADISDVQIILTDIYGNKGSAYSLNIQHRDLPLEKVSGLNAVLFDSGLRIFWDHSSADGYTVNVCTSGQCETFETKLTFAVYKKKFDNCLDITVYATSGSTVSEPSAVRFCR